MKKQYFPRLSFLSFWFYFLILFLPNTLAQQLNGEVFSHEETMISGGAEFNTLLQKAIRTGNVENFLHATTNTPPSSPENSLIITRFDGFDYDDNATYNSGFSFIPPDPSGAAGRDRVIAVVNAMIECRDTLGILLWQVSLDSLFTSLTPTTFTFDPKVIYDQYEDRFVVVDLEQVDAGVNPDPGNISRILLAVSKTSAPATATSADWNFHAISSEESIGGLDNWADYPGFAIDEEAVYVTANMFTHAPISGSSTATRLWIVDKGVVGGFYGGGTASVTGGWDFPTLSGGFVLTHQPAHVFGTGGVGGSVGTFLVGYSGLTGGGLEFIQVIRVDDPLGTPTFAAVEFVSLGDIETLAAGLPDAPQSGSATEIEVNDRRTLQAVWRSNSLWLTTTIDPGSGPDMGQTTAHWVQLSTSTLGSTTLTDQGNIGGEDIATGTFTFFPAIAVNSTGDMIVGFSASAPTIFPGAYYAGRYSTDSPGTVNPSVVVKAGVDFYERTFGGARNRWGDYTGACVDPSDDLTFWVYNEYAITRGSGTPPDDGKWGTAYAKVPLGNLPVELTSFTASVINNDVILKWSTATEINNQGFEIQKSNEYNEFEAFGYVPGYGTTTETRFYSFTDLKVDDGSYRYRLKQIDFNGTFEYSDEISVEVLNPIEFVLEQNFPNPFNPNTLIKYSIPGDGFVSLNVYNLLGEIVATLVNGTQEAGRYEIHFDASDLSSGIYLYNLKSGNLNSGKKMLLMK
ncbi:MAG: T9SS type A sorting domain-containing protein [Ignavibacteriaceae bacterium]